MLNDAEDYNFWDEADQMADRAFELYENGHILQALTQINEAIEINPHNSAWHFNAGLTLDSMDKFEEAIKSYQKALELTPDDPEMLNSLAIDYTRTGRYDMAIATFEHVEQINPHFEPSYCNRIITYTEMEMHEKAEQMFYLAQQINPDCPICFYNIGNSLFSRRNYEKAIWCWERTAMLEPTHPQINYRIAQAHWANDNPKLAKEHFLRELRSNTGDVDVILDFGIFQLKSGKSEDAKEKFNRILELQPEFAPAVFYLGELAMKEEDFTLAARHYKKAIKIDLEIAGPRYRLAQIAIGYGNNEEAKRLLIDETRLDVEDIDVLVSIAVMFIQINELDHAIDTLLGIVDEDQQNATAFYYMGMTLALQNELEGAMHFMEHAITLDDQNTEFLANAALVYLANDKIEQAKDTIEQAKELAGEDENIIGLSQRIQRAATAQKIRRYISSTPPMIKIRLFTAKYKSKIKRPIRRKL